MIYLLLGDNESAKLEALQKLRRKLLPAGDAENFDFAQWDAHRLDADTLKQSLDALPVIEKHRLVIVRQIQKLNESCQRVFRSMSDNPPSGLHVILEGTRSKNITAFLKALEKVSEAQEFSLGKKKNVFDMTRAMTSRNPTEALGILSQLMDQGEHPLKILGGLLWFWGQKAKAKISAEKFKKGLKVLQEADLNIKRSRLRPEYTMEELVLKLCSLLAY